MLEIRHDGYMLITIITSFCVVKRGRLWRVILIKPLGMGRLKKYAIKGF